MRFSWTSRNKVEAQSHTCSEMYAVNIVLNKSAEDACEIFTTLYMVVLGFSSSFWTHGASWRLPIVAIEYRSAIRCESHHILISR